jgi:hypothetical protein
LKIYCVVDLLGRYSNPGIQADYLREFGHLRSQRTNYPPTRRLKQVQHRLNGAAAAELVTFYEAGALISDLAEWYHIDRTTVIYFA